MLAYFLSYHMEEKIIDPVLRKFFDSLKAKDAKPVTKPSEPKKQHFGGAEKFDKVRAKVIQKEASSIANMPLKNKNFSHEVTISNRKIKERLNQPITPLNEKNEMLLDLKNIFYNAKYLCSLKDNPTKETKHKDVKWHHIFEIEIAGKPVALIVHEMRWGEFQIHEISEDEKLLALAKEKMES